MIYTDNAINILTVKTYKGIGRAWIVKNLKGNELKDFIDEFNLKNPDFSTSYSRIIEARSKYEVLGIAGLISKTHGNKGKSKLNPEWFEYFKNLYLVEGAPSAESCHRIVKGSYGKDNNDFCEKVHLFTFL